MSKLIYLIAGILAILVGVEIIKTKKFLHNGLVVNFQEPWQYISGGLIFIIFGLMIFYQMKNEK